MSEVVTVPAIALMISVRVVERFLPGAWLVDEYSNTLAAYNHNIEAPNVVAVKTRCDRFFDQNIGGSLLSISLKAFGDICLTFEAGKFVMNLFTWFKDFVVELYNNCAGGVKNFLKGLCERCQELEANPLACDTIGCTAKTMVNKSAAVKASVASVATGVYHSPEDLRRMIADCGAWVMGMLEASLAWIAQIVKGIVLHELRMYYFQCTAVFRAAVAALNRAENGVLIPPNEVANPNNRVQQRLPAANPVLAAAAGHGARRRPREDDEPPGQAANPVVVAAVRPGKKKRDCKHKCFHP